MENHARLYLVLKELMKEQKYDYATINAGLKWEISIPRRVLYLED